MAVRRDPLLRCRQRLSEKQRRRFGSWCANTTATTAIVACFLLSLLSEGCGQRSGRETSDPENASEAHPDVGTGGDEHEAVPESADVGSTSSTTRSDGAPLLDDLMPPAKSRPRPPAESTFLGLRDSVVLEALRERKAVGARRTGGSSLSMYLNLEGDIDASFKPHTFRGQRWSGEVAAYRLGRLLGIDRVPPATTRVFKAPVIEALLRDEPEILERFKADSVFSDDNTVKGAVVYWVPTIHRAEVDTIDELPGWTQWLKQGASIPPERLNFVQQLSDTIVFDYVTGNWDRWSIHNVMYGPQRKTLLIMDNNGAFGVRFSASVKTRLETPLQQVERYSASLYRRLVGLREEDYRAELAMDPAGESLLTEQQLEHVFSRRDQVIERIETLTRQHGHDAVLCFP